MFSLIASVVGHLVCFDEAVEKHHCLSYVCVCAEVSVKDSLPNLVKVRMCKIDYRIQINYALEPK